jgi:hypothetical protein
MLEFGASRQLAFSDQRKIYVEGESALGTAECLH